MSATKASNFNDPFEFHLQPGGPLTEDAAKSRIEESAQTRVFWDEHRKRYPGLTEDQLEDKFAAEMPRFVANLLANATELIEWQRKRIWELMESAGRVVCFSGETTDPSIETPMWAYYADMHRGVRIHVPEMSFPNKDSLISIFYSDVPPTLDLSLAVTSKGYWDYAYKVMRTKSRAWEHENETRVIIANSSWFSDKDSKGNQRDYIKVKPAFLPRLDLGIKCDKNDVEKAINLKTLYPTLRVYQAMKSPTAYAIAYKELV